MVVAQIAEGQGLASGPDLRVGGKERRAAVERQVPTVRVDERPGDVARAAHVDRVSGVRAGAAPVPRHEQVIPASWRATAGASIAFSGTLSAEPRARAGRHRPM